MRGSDDYCKWCRLRIAWWMSPGKTVHVYPLARIMEAEARARPLKRKVLGTVTNVSWDGNPRSFQLTVLTPNGETRVVDVDSLTGRLNNVDLSAWPEV